MNVFIHNVQSIFIFVILIDFRQTKIHNIGAKLVGVDKFGNKYYQNLETIHGQFFSHFRIMHFFTTVRSMHVQGDDNYVTSLCSCDICYSYHDNILKSFT